MEIICGKQVCTIDAATLASRSAGYREILVDIGTGDGRYIHTMARECPAVFAIGIDACRENLRAASRDAPDNALFVIANALALPRELHGLAATQITINFPWGSLLTALLDGDPGFFRGLVALAQPGARLEIRLNRGALVAAGYAPEQGATRIAQGLRAWGLSNQRAALLGADALRRYPTNWAKRLAYGRDPCGWSLAATVPARCASNAESVYSE